MLTFTATLFASFIAIATVFGLVNWCQKASTGDKAAVMGLYLLWGMPGVLMFVAGLALATNGRGEGAPVLGIGLGLALPLLKPFRNLVAKVTPMDPDSPIDYSGLAIVLALLGFLIPTAFVDSAPEVVSGNSGVALTSGLLQQLVAFVMIAYVAVGYRNYRTGEEATARLGIQRPTPQQIIAGLGGVVVAFVAANIGGLLTQWLQPDAVHGIEESVQAIVAGVTNPFVALVLALSSGIGEEVFFRGALQPRLGMVLTALLFTFLHAQYGFTWILLGLFLMGLTFGWLAKRYGTMAAVIAHATYNLIVVVLQVWVL
ncbi:MAG: CPBP family intramembrane metalloprotease [Thermomicrobiales bacterium]|nr:CPBP family intramembrane metalloprotease [Thermomicrobiales bacterium]